MTKVLFRRARKCLSFFTRSEFRGTADIELKQSGDFSGWFSVCFSHAKIKVYLRDARCVYLDTDSRLKRPLTIASA